MTGQPTTKADAVSSWWKAAGDFPHTKTLITFAVMGTVLAVVWKTASIIRTPQDGVNLLGALLPIVLIVLGWHTTSKGIEVTKQWLETKKANGDSPPSTP